MSDAENDFGNAGDMISGSQNPQEHNDWLDQHQQELERQRKTLEKQQRALTTPASDPVVPPTGMTPAKEAPTPPPSSEPLPSEPPGPVTPRPVAGEPDFIQKWTAPLEKLPPKEVDFHNENKFTGRDGPWDWAGKRYPRAQAKRMVQGRLDNLRGMSRDQRDVLFLCNYENDSTFRQRVNRAIHERQKAIPAVPSTEGAPVPAVSSSVPAEAKTKPSLTEQVARVNEPGDESMTLLYQQGLKLFSEAFGKDKAVTGYGRAYPAHSDPSAAPVYRAIGQTAENALGRANAVNGNGTRPPGHLDESMGPAEGELFRNMNHDAVAKAQQAISQAEGFTYDREHGTREAYSFLKGIYMIPAEIKIGLYGLASLGGELIYRVAGGDPTGLRKVQQTLKQYQQEMAALKPLTLDSLYVKGRPDQTMQNVTDYLYQQLGNQLVKVPAYYLLGKIESIAALTGISSTKLSSQIHADILNQSGNTDPTDAVVYGVPLGLLSLLGVPAKAPFSINSPAELKAWVMSLLADFSIGQAQEAGARFAVDESKNKEDKPYPRQ